MPQEIRFDKDRLTYAFDGAALKVERAKSHIDEIEDILSNIQAPESEPFILTRDSGGRYILKLSALGHRGRYIPVMLGDALHNLRSALDHVWTALDRELTGRESKACFPFERTRGGVKVKVEESIVFRKIPKVRELVLDKVKTYSTDGGDHVLWSLTKLNNIDKHNTLVPIIEVNQVENLMVRSGDFSMNFKNTTFQNVSNLFLSDLPVEYRCAGGIQVSAVFGSGLPVAGYSLVPTLRQMSVAVGAAINLFRREFT